MNIYSKPGTKVIFSGENGYEFEQANARMIFTIGQEVTLKAIDVSDWSTSVQFEEYPNKWYNSVMFKDKE